MSEWGEHKWLLRYSQLKGDILNGYDKDGKPIPKEVLETMHNLGFLHDSEVALLTGTSERTRARWLDPPSIMFGNERWWPLVAIKKHLEAKMKPVKRPPLL